VAALVAAPWTWFLWRDRVGPIGALRSPVVTVREAIAIFLPPLLAAVLVACLVVALVRRRWVGPALVGVSVLAFGWTAVLAPWQADHGHDLAGAPGWARVVVANPRYRNANMGAIEDVLAQDGDVVVVAEPGPVSRALAEAFPHAETVFDTGGRGELAVLSRFPLERADQRANLLAHGVFRFVVHAPSGSFVLYAAHPKPPGLGAGHLTPPRQLALYRRVLSAARAEQLPIVLAGDLNLVDRSAAFRHLTGWFDDATAGHQRTATSLRWPFFLARIDHVLVGPGWCGGGPTTYDIAGSDHHGVAATVGPCPGRA
jgi:endonuclease/exonuclease/phosphatase (EEP) superfamily protein YafD